MQYGQRVLQPNSFTLTKIPHLNLSHLPMFGLYYSEPFVSMYLAECLLNVPIVPALTTLSGSSFHILATHSMNMLALRFLLNPLSL